MKNTQKGIFSLNSSFFILISLLILDFGIPVHADQSVKREELEPQFLKSELDSELISYFFNRIISKDALKSQNPVEDSVAQLNSSSIENLLTLLKNIEVELSALRMKTNEETQELKSRIADLGGKIRGQGNEIKEKNQITIEIQRDESQIKQKIEANHNEIQKQFADLSKDLKGQINSLSNQIQQQQKELSKSRENEMKTEKNKEKEIPKQNQNKEIINVNRNDQIRFPQYNPRPTRVPIPNRGQFAVPMPNPFSSALSAPQFYYFEQFRGSSFTPSSDEWKSKCVDLPFAFSGFTSSLKTGGHCLFVCPEKNCQAEGFGYFKTECQTINPNTKEIGKLRGIGMESKIKSFRKC